MKKFGNKGITLVALVVTIIVLIILAGVSISLILGQDGVVQKAKQGRDSYAEAAKIENEQLANVDAFAMTVQEMTPSTSTVTGEITNMTDGEIEISATVNLEGNIDFTKTKYVFTTSNSPLGTNDETIYKDGTIDENNTTIIKSKAAGTYYLHVLATDIKGDKIEIISEETASSTQGKKDFDYTGNAQNITLTPGRYKLEVWGASGYNNIGKGGYSVGTLTLQDEKVMYIYVGGTTPSTHSGGYNGGGNGDGYDSPAGGGGTDIRLEQDSLYARIIVAGGGGGYRTGTTDVCNANSTSTGSASPGTISAPGTGGTGWANLVQATFGNGATYTSGTSDRGGGGRRWLVWRRIF